VLPGFERESLCGNVISLMPCYFLPGIPAAQIDHDDPCGYKTEWPASSKCDSRIMTPIQLITAKRIRQSLSMSDAIDLVARAFIAVSRDEVDMPQRLRLDLGKGDALVMPANLPAELACSIKIVSVFPENGARGLPTCSGALMLLNGTTGGIEALMDAHTLTTLRTGAAGGLAAKWLAREDATKLACFGAGDQAAAQIEAVLTVRDIACIDLFTPTPDRSDALAAHLRNAYPAVEVNVNRDPAKIVPTSDIVVAATTSMTPVFEARWIQPGTHVTGVGSYRADMAELPAHLLQQARVFVDSRRAAAQEAGDLLQAGVTPDAELGEVVLGRSPGRTSSSQITVFKSVGLAAQDAAIARAVLRAALKKGYCKEIAF